MDAPYDRTSPEKLIDDSVYAAIPRTAQTVRHGIDRDGGPNVYRAGQEGLKGQVHYGQIIARMLDRSETAEKTFLNTPAMSE